MTIGGKYIMKKGFTLVEIMIVVAIIGLLAAIAIPSFMRARMRSQQNACINNLRQIESAKEQYGMEWGLTNLSTITFTNIVGHDNYIRSWPLCPASTTVEANAGNSANDYTISVLGSNALCRIVPSGTYAHALPTQ